MEFMQMCMIRIFFERTLCYFYLNPHKSDLVSNARLYFTDLCMHLSSWPVISSLVFGFIHESWACSFTFCSIFRVPYWTHVHENKEMWNQNSESCSKNINIKYLVYSFILIITVISIPLLRVQIGQSHLSQNKFSYSYCITHTSTRHMNNIYHVGTLILPYVPEIAKFKKTPP